MRKALLAVALLAGLAFVLTPEAQARHRRCGGPAYYGHRAAPYVGYGRPYYGGYSGYYSRGYPGYYGGYGPPVGVRIGVGPSYYGGPYYGGYPRYNRGTNVGW